MKNEREKAGKQNHIFVPLFVEVAHYRPFLIFYLELEMSMPNDPTRTVQVVRVQQRLR
jgi:hypothetical protein